MPPSQSPAPAASGRRRKQAPPKKPMRVPQRPKLKAAQPKRPRARTLTLRDLPMYAQCVLNPFDMPACGYPDYFNQPTIKLKLVDTFTMSPDAAGYACASVASALLKCRYANTVTAGTINATGAGFTQHPDYTSVTAQTYWARVVCMGVQIDYIGAAQTASGTLTIIREAAYDYWAGATVDSCIDDGVSMPAIEGRKVAMIPTQSPRFEVDNVASAFNPTFENLYILGSGLAGTAPVFRVTVTRHVEGLPLKSAVLARSSATKTPANPTAFTAVSGVPTDNNATTSTWEAALFDYAQGAWSAVKDAAVPVFQDAVAGAAAAGIAALAL